MVRGPADPRPLVSHSQLPELRPELQAHSSRRRHARLGRRFLATRAPRAEKRTETAAHWLPLNGHLFMTNDRLASANRIRQPSWVPGSYAAVIDGLLPPWPANGCPVRAVTGSCAGSAQSLLAADRATDIPHYHRMVGRRHGHSGTRYLRKSHSKLPMSIGTCATKRIKHRHKVLMPALRSARERLPLLRRGV
jgi:hypothetical protein